MALLNGTSSNVYVSVAEQAFQHFHMVPRANKIIASRKIGRETRYGIHFAHMALIDLDRDLPNIADFPKTIPLWWKNKMAGDRNLLYMSMFLPQTAG